MTRLKREHGRLMSVETKVRGDSLVEDAAAGATSLVVGDAGDFDEDGGWLVVNDQVIEYLEADDDEGTITLATGLSAAADEGDAVHVWSTLYDEAVDYQEALVELDGEYDNPEPVVAEVAEGVGDLPEGDRGVAGESCTLLRVSDDEWEVVGVGGRGRRSKGIRFEANDSHTVTTSDLSTASLAMALSHRPIDESLTAYWNGVFQPPSAYSIDYDRRVISWALDDLVQDGDELAVHYAYRKGVRSDDTVLLDWASPGWKFKQVALSDSNDYSASGYDDSSWATVSAPFGQDKVKWPPVATPWDLDTAMWARITISPGALSSATVRVRIDNEVQVYWNGTQIGDSTSSSGDEVEYNVPSGLLAGPDFVIAVRAADDEFASGTDGCYFDLRVTGAVA